MTSSMDMTFVILGSNAQAVDTAIYLMSQGKKVTVITPSAKEDFEKGHSVNMKEFVEPTFFANGGRLFPNATVTGVGDGFGAKIDGFFCGCCSGVWRSVRRRASPRSRSI